jgi:hypothetical protein
MPLCPMQVQNLQPHIPALFCPFSPEAVLLTGRERYLVKKRSQVLLARCLLHNTALRGVTTLYRKLKE